MQMVTRRPVRAWITQHIAHMILLPRCVRRLLARYLPVLTPMAIQPPVQIVSFLPIALGVLEPTLVFRHHAINRRRLPAATH